MKTLLTLLPLAILLPLAACSKSEADTKTGAEAAAAGLDPAAAKLESLDLSKLAPEALVANAKSTLDDLAKQLGAVKDGQGAKDLVAKFQPVVDQLVGLKDKLAGHIDTAALEQAIADFSTKFQAQEDVKKIVEPLLAKLNALVG